MASTLTKAVQNVVKIIEIVVAILHGGPVAHSVIELAVGVCHCARAGRGDQGAEGTVTTLNRGALSWPSLASCPGPQLSCLCSWFEGTSASLTCWLLVKAPRLVPLICLHLAFLCLWLGLLPLQHPWRHCWEAGEAVHPLGPQGRAVGSNPREGKARSASCSTELAALRSCCPRPES